MPFEVRRAGVADCAPLAQVLARAFFEDPIAAFIYPDSANRHARLTYFFDVQLRHNYYPRGEIYTTNTLIGVAMWFAPRPPSPSPRQLMAQIPLYVVSMMRSRAVVRLAQFLAAHHPRNEHYYLGTIGVAPEAQRQGVASALMYPVLERCDAQKIPAYLECSSEENVVFYSQHGFVVTKELTAPGGGPPIWLMWREPRTG